MYYSIRHVTKFRYNEPITESVMDIRMQPQTEGPQRCLKFDLRTTPRAAIASFTDPLGNTVHHFDVPDRHSHLTIRAEALVEIVSSPPVPESMGSTTWSELDALTATDEYWDTLAPSHFARPTDLLHALQRELRLTRSADPLSTLRDLNTAIHDLFEYDTESTSVDSPIDTALTSRHGVCQDFAHIMIALGRELGIPCRYVSGYLYHRNGDLDRSPPDATHAWVEAFLPNMGWMGFDPTNNLVAGERHIRVAVGRDYADVPPTRGVFKGRAETELAVSVRVMQSHAPLTVPPDDEEAKDLTYRPTMEIDGIPPEDLHEQPQQ